MPPPGVCLVGAIHVQWFMAIVVRIAAIMEMYHGISPTAQTEVDIKSSRVTLSMATLRAVDEQRNSRVTISKTKITNRNKAALN